MSWLGANSNKPRKRYAFNTGNIKNDDSLHYLGLTLKYDPVPFATILPDYMVGDWKIMDHNGSLLDTFESWEEGAEVIKSIGGEMPPVPVWEESHVRDVVEDLKEFAKKKGNGKGLYYLDRLLDRLEESFAEDTER